MKTIFKILILSVIAIAGYVNNQAIAGSISARIAADTNEVLIGDRIMLELTVRADSSLNIFWPPIPDTINTIEILSRTRIDTAIQGEFRTLTQRFSVTCFDSGSYEIPSFVVMYEKPGFETLYPAETNPLFLTFHTVRVDTAEAIKDIKGPMREPFSILDYLWEIIIAILLLGVIITGIYFWINRKPEEIIALDYDPTIPAHLLALESLNKLDNEKLWQKGQVKKYHSILTNIIRLYIERSFEVQALEMTSNEIISGIKITEIPIELINKLERMLSVADQVKFAKVTPLPDENSESMNLAVEFVNTTMALNASKNEDTNTETKTEAPANQEESA